jgi:Hinge domain of cleavage stimulation factor subunit 2
MVQLRVSFASQTSLKDKAKQEIDKEPAERTGVSLIQGVVASKPLHEAWDILEAMKKLVEEDRGTARKLLEAQPQLVFAVFEIQVFINTFNRARNILRLSMQGHAAN